MEEGGRRDPRTLYSVFVGHLHPDVTKADLLELFSNCGNVEDLHFVDSQQTYKFGFVRYRDLEPVYKAVKELNRWSLKGIPIVVDISKDTRDRIAKDKIEAEDKLLTKKKPATEIPSKSKSRPSSSYINDVMYLSRVKETCSALNFEVTKQNAELIKKEGPKLRSLDIDKLLNDMASIERCRPKTMKGEISESASLESVKEKLLMSDDVSGDDAKIRADNFISVLSEVMQTISTFMGDKNKNDKTERKQEVKHSLTKGSTCVKQEDFLQGIFDDAVPSAQSKEDDKLFCIEKSVDLGSLQNEVKNSQLVGVNSVVDNGFFKNSSPQTSLATVNHVDSDSWSVSSDDGDCLNGDSGVELDSVTLRSPRENVTLKEKESVFSRQSSDEMPPLECTDQVSGNSPTVSPSSSFPSDCSSIGKGQSSFNCGQTDTDIRHKDFSSPEPENDKDLPTHGLHNGVESNSENLSSNKKGDFVEWIQSKLAESASTQNEDHVDDSKDALDQASGQNEKTTHFTDWVNNKLSISASAHDKPYSDRSNTTSTESSSELPISPELQSYYFKAILGRGRGLNTTSSRPEKEQVWYRGGRWGRPR